MIHLSTIRVILDHGDWCNNQLLECASVLTDEQLDRRFDMGPGSIRRTLLHMHAGEAVWLERWKGAVEAKWVDEAEHASVSTMADRWAATRRQRDQFLTTLNDTALAREQRYRDSRGSLYRATLGDMILQSCLHSTYHRAQTVNMLRQVGAKTPELDYMYRVRRPA